MRKRVSRPKIWLIEEYKGLQSLIVSRLVEEGFRVKAIRTLEEAVAQLAKETATPAALVLDTLNQPLSLDALDSLPDDIPLLVCTGPLDAGGPLLVQRPHTTLLQKPFTIAELVDGVGKMCYKEN
jgi:DNA-binding NtrC family response regulator